MTRTEGKTWLQEEAGCRRPIGDFQSIEVGGQCLMVRIPQIRRIRIGKCAGPPGGCGVAVVKARSKIEAVGKK